MTDSIFDLKKEGWCYSHRPLCPNYMPMFWLFHFNIFKYIKVWNKIHICTIFFRYCYFYAPALLKFGPTSFFQHIILNLYKFYNILILILCKSYAFDFNQDFFLEILDRAFYLWRQFSSIHSNFHTNSARFPLLYWHFHEIWCFLSII